MSCLCCFSDQEVGPASFCFKTFGNWVETTTQNLSAQTMNWGNAHMWAYIQYLRAYLSFTQINDSLLLCWAECQDANEEIQPFCSGVLKQKCIKKFQDSISCGLDLWLTNTKWPIWTFYCWIHECHLVPECFSYSVQS